jgi:hypothetical protein
MRITKKNPPARSSSEIAIFGRLLEAEKGNLSRGLAHHVLSLGFGEADQARMRDLAARNQGGGLTPQEQDELRNFVKASHLLAILRSKARKSLNRRRGR